MEKYSYEPLNLDRPAIRLLHLHQGGDNSEISCSLFQAELNQRTDTVSYEALSYTWGAPALTGRILVDGCYLNVTHNLYSALQQLCDQDEDRILWIDAICIDQGNTKERGHQVEQMSKIYSEAERVIFWLGPGTVRTDMLMESLKLLQRKSIRYDFGDWPFPDDHWKLQWTSLEPQFEIYDKDFRILQRQGLKELLARPWFRRVWILQEVALAKAGIISCGKKSVSARLFGLLPMVLGIEPDTHCQSILDIMPSPWRKTSWWSKSPDLRALLLYFGDSEATESRDLVYALRGMSSDAAGRHGIVPDYEKSEGVLVREVVQLVEHCELEGLALKTPPRTVRDLIKCLRARTLDRCMNLARWSLPSDMEMHLERTKIRVNQQMIMTAAEYDKTGEVIEVLLRHRPKEFILDDTILLPAAKNKIGAKGVFEALFHYQGGHIKIPNEVLMAAARNESCGAEILTTLFYYQRAQIKISEEVLKAAASNPQCGNRKSTSMSSFRLRRLEANPSGLLAAAAANEGCGDKVMDIILSYHPNLAIFSEEIAIAAAKNTDCGDRVMGILLSYHPNLAIFSEELAIAAAKNRGCGDRVMDIFLSYNHSPNIISKEIAIAAASNRKCGKRVMDILLSHNPSPNII